MIPQLKCFNHPDQDIVMVNLAKDVNNQHRTLCHLCMDKIQLDWLCSIQNIPLKTKEFAKTELDWLAEQYNPQIERISKIRKSVATLRAKSDNMFKDVIQAIDDLSSSFKTVLNGEQNFYKNAFSDITKSKLEDLGDLLSGHKIRDSRTSKPYVKLIEFGNKFGLHFKSFIHELKVTVNQIESIFKNQYFRITYQLTDNKVTQVESCWAVAFNKEGSTMVAGCDSKIKVWRLENGKLKEQLQVLEGHSYYVNCLVFSKKTNWFASGSDDCTIRCWKDMGYNDWKSSQQQQVHTGWIQGISLNQNEDQLISCSADNSIKVWRVDQQNNEISYEYSLDKHTNSVYCISLNESETTLVSCSLDKQILIWGRGENKKWEYKYPITKSVDDYGNRICFLNDNMIAWQQQNQGFTHLFKFENDKFIEKPELKIGLKQDGRDGGILFPSVFNKSKQVLIQKHEKYVYIIRVLNDGKQFNIEYEPIDCNYYLNYGGLTADGYHLVIWSLQKKEFRVYRLNYE